MKITGRSRGNWILSPCRPHKVTSGQKNTEEDDDDGKPEEEGRGR